jgi:preprotein translocase subunit SecG
VSVGIIVLVLMQQGKGADAGAAFGSGASGTVFGSRGSANFLSRTTAILAAIFFLNSIGLAFLASGRTIKSVSIMDSAAPAVSQPVTTPTVPVVGDVPPAPGGVTPETNVQSGDMPPASNAKPPAKPEDKKPVTNEKQVQEKKP